MTRLTLRLFGALHIAFDNTPVTAIGYAKGRALLAYLAAEADRAHPRDGLVALLWPDLPLAAGRTNLRQVLANLLKTLGSAHGTPYLLVTRDAIRFNAASPYDLDVATFTTLLATCDQHVHHHSTRCRSCARRLEQAVACYQGDFLAHGALNDSEPFEDWLTVTRERLHLRVLGALEQLAAYYQRCGDLDRARHTLQHQITLEPWREEAYLQLMHLLAQQGQRSAALSMYETGRQVMAREFGAEPTTEAVELYQRLRTGAPLNPVRGTIPPTHHMPMLMTPLIGRDAEHAALCDLLERPDRRLITLVGPGGVGKTRLAVAVAQTMAPIFRNGAVFVALDGLETADLFAETLLAALNMPLSGQRTPQQQVLEVLADREQLLVLDNCEHLLADHVSPGVVAALLADILRAAPQVILLATSRQPIELRAEWVFDINGLAFPPALAPTLLESYDAVQFFIARARQIHPHLTLTTAMLQAIAQICRAVEGLPLGLELAAASVRAQSCAEIADTLATHVAHLTTTLHDMPERQRSLWATVAYSWRLLTLAEQQVLRRLAVFRGGIALAAAEAVAGATLPQLTALAQRSLLCQVSSERYAMHEAVRQYADTQLTASGEAVEIRREHVRCLLTQIKVAEPELFGPNEQAVNLTLGIERDNIRAALTWSFGDNNHTTVSHDITHIHFVAHLWRFWYLQYAYDEGQTWITQAITTLDRHTDSAAGEHALLRAKLYTGAGFLAQVRGQNMQAIATLEQAVKLYRCYGTASELALALQELGSAFFEHGDELQALQAFKESLMLYRHVGDTWGISGVQCMIGDAIKQEDPQQGRALLEEGLLVARTNNYSGYIAGALINLGELAIVQRDYPRAEAVLHEALTFTTETDAQTWAWALRMLGLTAQMQGDYHNAEARYAQALALRHTAGDQGGSAWCLEGLAEVATVQGEPFLAARRWGAAQATRSAAGSMMAPIDRQRHEQYVAVAQEQVDITAFRAAWAEGATIHFADFLTRLGAR